MIENDRLLIALAQGLSVRDAAKEAGISEPTAFRRLREPVFVAELNRVRTDMWDNALGQLTACASEAVATLRRLMSDANSDSVKLRAAQLVLEQSCRLRESIEFDSRLSALEDVNDAGRHHADER